MKSFARVRSIRFDWQKLVTPITPKAVVAEYTAKQAEINALNSAASTVPTTVESVDWAYWKGAIQTPGVVEQMQKDYEALSFPDVDPMSAGNVEKIAGIEESIVEAKKAAALGLSELKAVDGVISQVDKVKAGGLGWTLEQWHAFMPGLEAQHKSEYENEDYLVSDDHQKLDAVDWKAAGEEFTQGVNPDMGGTDAQIGDMNLAEEMELVNAGRWSVARLFASKAERTSIQEKTDKLLNSAA